MKKTILCFAMATAIIAASCSKKTDSATPVTSATGTIMINGVSYAETKSKDTTTTDFFGEAGHLLVAQGNTSDLKKYEVIYLVFKNNTARPTAGDYHIGVTANNYVAVLVNDSSAAGQGLYSSDSVTSLTANIAINSGKITATVPTIRLTGLFTPVGGSTYNDTITVSGTVVEK